MAGLVAFLTIISTSLVGFLVYKDRGETDSVGKGAFRYGRNARMVTLLSVPCWMIFALIIFVKSRTGANPASDTVQAGIVGVGIVLSCIHYAFYTRVCNYRVLLLDASIDFVGIFTRRSIRYDQIGLVKLIRGDGNEKSLTVFDRHEKLVMTIFETIVGFSTLVEVVRERATRAGAGYQEKI